MSTPVSDAASDRVAAFFDLRARWAGTHNLSGPRALAHPHLVDLADAEALLRVLASELPLVDVGAGSGVPGLLVACLDPARPVVVVEPLVKRAAFLRTAAHQLGLKAVRVERARWPLPLAEPVQVVSRAVVSPEEWPALAAEGGTAVQAILRYLAAQRPPVRVPGFELAAHHDYTVDGAARRVERWQRVS
ncbi:MAG: RsmG family class I SAM-dependent methyltransferase [bacterium]